MKKIVKYDAFYTLHAFAKRKGRTVTFVLYKSKYKVKHESHARIWSGYDFKYRFNRIRLLALHTVLTTLIEN